VVLVRPLLFGSIAHPARRVGRISRVSSISMVSSVSKVNRVNRVSRVSRVSRFYKVTWARCNSASSISVRFLIICTAT
jgi:hypothetical protein